MNNLKIVILVIVIFIVGVSGIYWIYQSQVITNDDLLSLPSPVTEISFNGLISPTPSTQPISKVDTQSAPAIQPESGSNTVELKNIGIKINSPKASSIISNPVTVSGSANVFEGNVQINIKNANGNILGSDRATTCMGLDACPFSTTINFSPSSTQTGTIEVYSPSGVDGSPNHLQHILIRF